MCNSTRMSVALHFGNFLFEQMGKPEEAAEMCQLTVDECNTRIDDISEEQYVEAMHLVDLLKENITLWKSEIKPTMQLTTAPVAK